MSDKAINWIIKISFSLVLLLFAGGLWYYTMGRKPHLLISAPIKASEAAAVVRTIAPNEVLLLAGTRATLYDLATKQARWNANLAAVTAATPAPKAPPKPIAAPPPAAQEKPDPLLAARVKKRFAKLEKWAGELNEKRGRLKTPIQIEAFNVEAAKYHAELVAAREEAGTLAPARPASRGHADDDEDERTGFSSYLPAHVEIAALNGSIWIAQGARVTGLDRADGHVLKTVTLPGNVTAMERGPEELFVLAAVGQGREVQITRIIPGNATTPNITVAVPAEPREETWVQGTPQRPTIAEHRILFSANHSSLLQLDVRLKEKKLTERVTISGDAGSDMEAADKKTTGGFGNDALVMAQALSRESEREQTGGKEIIDESTYEVTLQRPFSPALPAATALVHGRADVFSTPNLDLIAAGKDLVAFDHSNKKLWQAQLAQPIAPVTRFALSDDEESSTAHPCLEAGDRLYFFDTAYVTAFNRQTGQPAWRLPLKEIHKIQLDDSDHLYVSSHAGGLGEAAQLFRVEAKTGRVIWKVEKYDDWFVSGQELYVTRETRNAEDMVNAVFDRSKAPQCRWKLYKLSTRNGDPQWEWFQTRRPARVEADHKRVSLLFQDELQIVTSIAL
ncbi:MAG: PQQ-binding-like beta-propeller repeat protein [Chthoniobacteraceae bacterium]